MLWPMTGREPSDVRDSLAVAAMLLNRADLAPWGDCEEATWLCGPSETLRPVSQDARSPAIATAAFPDTGYVAVRTDSRDHAVFDVGAHGYLNGGHAHADALSLCLAVNGVPLLVDTGTATYTMDPAMRDRFRDARSHNTLLLDQRPPSIPAGPFHWHTRADASLATLRSSHAFAWIEGVHRGFGPAAHVRSLVHAGEGWMVIDHVTGQGHHLAERYWHFDPRWAVTCDGAQRLKATDADGRVAWLLHDAPALTLECGDETGGLGWYAPRYGRVVPTWSAVSATHVNAPATLCAWLGVGNDVSQPDMRTRSCEHDAGASAVVVEVRPRIGVAELLLLRPADAAGRPGRSASFDGYATDARLLYRHEDANDTGLAVVVADASYLSGSADVSLTIAAPTPMHDLAVTVDGEGMNLRASVPPPELIIRGTAAGRTRRLRLNGRDVPLTPERRRDGVAVRGGDWADLGDVRTACVA
jgi:hypothetical protein